MIDSEVVRVDGCMRELLNVFSRKIPMSLDTLPFGVEIAPCAARNADSYNTYVNTHYPQNQELGGILEKN